MSEIIDRFWRERFSGCAADAAQLKFLFWNRWVRFHSLPQSKRYPDTEDEYREILSRHNQLLGELSNEGESVYVIASEFSSHPQPRSLPKKLVDVMPGSQYWNTLSLHEPDDEEEYRSYAHQYVFESQWERGAFDRLLCLVSDEEVVNIMIVSVCHGWIYHPYDGGADVILPSEKDRDEIKQRHRSWLSVHPSGL